MNNQYSSKFFKYTQENMSLYIFTVILFIMGIVLGSYLIYSLSGSQKQDILTALNMFFSGINNLELNADMAFKEILFGNLKYLLIIWFLGLSIIGMPFIYVLIYLKGVIVGFTVSFFVFEMNFRGFILALVAIIPQNLIIVPVLIIAGVCGGKFSLQLIKSRKNNNFSYLESFKLYCMINIVLAIALVVATALESFVSPYLIKLAGNLLN